MKKYILAFFAFATITSYAQEKRGADIPWVTYEAENMKTTGTVSGPKYNAFQVETESSGQKCVKLTKKGHFVEFKASKKANSIVIRYSLPDNAEGGKGTNTALGIYKNKKLVATLDVSSRHTMLYGNYPFKNDPAAGKPRNYYDEIRLKDIQIAQGDVIKIQKEDAKVNTADYAIIDLVDLEEVPAALTAPANALSITDKAFGTNTNDYTEALKKAVAKSAQTKQPVWIPAGTFQITGFIDVPSDVTIQGAGMWHTTLMGHDSLYEDDASRRIRFFGLGNNIHLSDFAIAGQLNYRADDEPNDGIGGAFGTGSTIQRLWIEHTKVGVWVENSKGLLVEGCRFRNTIADGINFCVGMRECTMKNCTARGTGDDCFAMWPATFMRQNYAPGKNLIVNCTASLPFLANGAAIYGGESNKISNCLFTDISPGSAIIISTTFPTEDPVANNHFTGTTVIENCDIKTSGGFDHSWEWRASISLVLDKRGISGIEINNVNIDNSMSDGISVVTRLEYQKPKPVLTNATFKNVKITNSGIGATGKHALWLDNYAGGEVTITNSNITDIKNDSQAFKVVTK